MCPWGVYACIHGSLLCGRVSAVPMRTPRAPRLDLQPGDQPRARAFSLLTSHSRPKLQPTPSWVAATASGGYTLLKPQSAFSPQLTCALPSLELDRKESLSKCPFSPGAKAQAPLAARRQTGCLSLFSALGSGQLQARPAPALGLGVTPSLPRPCLASNSLLNLTLDPLHSRPVLLFPSLPFHPGSLRSSLELRGAKAAFRISEADWQESLPWGLVSCKE